MQIFNNFAELHAANTTSNAHLVSVKNHYGNGVPTLVPQWSKVFVSANSNELMSLSGDRSLRERSTWEYFKSIQPPLLGMELSVTDAKSDVCSEPVIVRVNMHTGTLYAGSALVGTLSKNPVDAAIAAIDRGDKYIIAAIEREIWEFINHNPNKFNWRYK